MVKKMSLTNKNINTQEIAAYILAGGESRRFNGQIKAMQILKGKPLIAHAIDRLSTQIQSININTHLPGFADFNCPIVSDDPQSLYQGPLSGLLACMQHMHHSYPEKNWLLLTPCDAPLIPEDLLTQLNNTTRHKGVEAACISYETELQPTFSIWHKCLLGKIEHAVLTEKWGGLKIFFQHLNDAAYVVEYPKQTNNPFLNINNQIELDRAEKHP